MNRITASYLAVFIGAAAAAAATPILARKMAAAWPSAQTAPVRTADVEPESPPGAPASPMISSAPAPAAAIERPGFDVVRVDPTGETVVSGHATPKAAVELRDGGRVIAKVDADESGQFVVLPPPLPTGSHRLELAAQDGGAPVVVSDPVTVDIAERKPDAPGHLAIPPLPPAAAMHAAEGELPKSGVEHGDPATPQPRTVASADRPAPLPVPPGAAGALAAEKPAPRMREAAPAPPAVAQTRLKAPAYVARIQPPPVRPALEAGPRVSVRTVEAPGLGRLEVTGVAAPNSIVRLYLNGSRIFDTAAGTDRRWSLTIDRGMSPGFYTFRAEEIDRSNGAVSARAEVAFSYPPRRPQSRR